MSLSDSWRADVQLPGTNLKVVMADTVWIEDSDGNVLLEFESFDEYSGIQTIGGSLQQEFDGSYGDRDPIGTAAMRLVELMGFWGRLSTEPELLERVQRSGEATIRKRGEGKS